MSKNQLGAVDHGDGQRRREISQLRGREFVVEDHDVGVLRLNVLCEFFGLAGADVHRHVGRAPALDVFCQDLRSGSCGQFA